MATVALGTITPYKTSLFKVLASVSVEGINLTYKYSSGQLPPGLSIQQDGEIVGTCRAVARETTYTFTVQASGQFGNIVSTQDYSIRVVPVTTDEIGSMYGVCHIDSASLTTYKNFINNTAVFPPSSLYRPSSEEFNTLKPKFLFLSGVHITRLETIQNLLLNNNYSTNLYFGDYKLAKAKSQSGNVLYEVIYADLIDPIADSPDTITLTSVGLPSISIDFSTEAQQFFTDNGLSVPTGAQDTLFMNSIERMQNEIKAGITDEVFEYLPRWMSSSQNDGVLPGFKLALPLRYVKPGEGEKILYRVKNESNYNIQSVKAHIDRWYIDSNLGTTFDSNTTTFNESGYPPTADTTLFTADDTDYVTNTLTVFDNSTTFFDGDGTRFLKSRITFDRGTPQDAQLLMQRTAITDRITHISRQRELVRTP